MVSPAKVGDNRCWVDTGLGEVHVPVVFLTMESDYPNLSIVSIDNYLGAKMATEHLLQQGYRHIGHISGPLDWWESRQRQAGWQAALAEAGIEVLESHCVEGNWSASSGETAFWQLVSQYPDMDAVFVGNDQMALSVLQVSSRDGISIPSQLGVVGFDGWAETAYYSPPLTTVYQDQHHLGCTVVEEIVRSVEKVQRGETLDRPSTIILKPELIVRESSTNTMHETSK
jgi:LacI family transcriptional regulator